MLARHIRPEVVKIVRSHYKLNRNPSTEECQAEVNMVFRRGLWDLDDRQRHLAAQLGKYFAFPVREELRDAYAVV